MSHFQSIILWTSSCQSVFNIYWMEDMTVALVTYLATASLAVGHLKLCLVLIGSVENTSRHGSLMLLIVRCSWILTLLTEFCGFKSLFSAKLPSYQNYAASSLQFICLLISAIHLSSFCTLLINSSFFKIYFLPPNLLFMVSVLGPNSG